MKFRYRHLVYVAVLLAPLAMLMGAKAHTEGGGTANGNNGASCKKDKDCISVLVCTNGICQGTGNSGESGGSPLVVTPGTSTHTEGVSHP